MRRKIVVLGSLLAAGALGFSAAAANAGSINVGSASGAAGATVSVDVTLTTAGAAIAGTQNDITFDASTPVARKANGKPDCTVNPGIDKSASSFAFRPAACTAETCTAIRALVLSTDNTDPIVDGSTLYTCKVAISASATGGAKALTASGVILSSPAGTRVTPADGTNGAVTVEGGGPTPTATTPAGMPCDPVRAAPAAPALYVDDLNLAAVGDATISVKLAAGTAQVAGTQNDIGFGGVTFKRKANGKPDCTVNAAIDKTATSFAFRPASCTEATCDSVRALVLSTDNTDPIVDGSVLYTCNVTVSSTGTETLPVTGVILSTPAGTRVPNPSGRDGKVCVPVVGPTHTPTATVPQPTATVTQRPTATVTPPTVVVRTATATATRQPSAVGTAALEDEGGCQINAAGTSSNGWLLLIPVAAALVIRRRSR